MRVGLCQRSFFFFYLSSRKSVCLSSYFYICQFQSLHFLLSILIRGSIIRVLNVFSLVLELQFIINYFLQLYPYCFNFFFFSLDSFVKVLFVFNSIIQSKFMLFYYFQLGVFTVRFGSIRFRRKKPTKLNYINFVKY